MFPPIQIPFALTTLFTLLMIGNSWTQNYVPTLASTSVWISEDSRDDDRIWHASEVDIEPQPINYQQVEEWIGYPETAYNAGIQGDVSLRVLVDQEGQYVKHEVENSFHPLLRIPCEVFTQLLEFKPASKNGEAVTCWVKVSYHFEIPDYGK